MPCRFGSCRSTAQREMKAGRWLHRCLCLAWELGPNSHTIICEKLHYLVFLPNQGTILLLQPGCFVGWTKPTRPPLPQGIFQLLFSTTSTSLQPTAASKLRFGLAKMHRKLLSGGHLLLRDTPSCWCFMRSLNDQKARFYFGI